MKISAVFFDMDGVLLDSIDVWFHMFNHALGILEGKEPISKEEFTENLWGTPPEHSKNYFTRSEMRERIKIYEEVVLDFIKYAVVFPESKPVLKQLKNEGYKTALITNTPKLVAEQMLNHFGLQDYFDAVVAHGEVKNPKPAPDMLIRACELLEVEKENVIFVGDTNSDMKAGESAGILRVGVGICGDYRISNVSELIAVLNSLE